jgi:flagellar motor component MotA
MKNVDPRMVFGFGLLMAVIVLALVIAMGKVHQESSYGLEIVLGSLSTLSGAFAQWAFSKPAVKVQERDES